MNSDEVKISYGSPETFGWQRRPDLDTPSGIAWEKPDGQIWLTPKNGPKPMLARLKERIRWDKPDGDE
jgi:hypothetical protein